MFKATLFQKSCSVKVIHSFFFIKYQMMMIFININIHFKLMKSTCSEHLCIYSWCRSWRLTLFLSFIVICKTSLMMKVISYLTVMFINDLSNSSDSNDFDFVDSHFFINAVSFINCFKAAWVLDWLSFKFFSFSFSSSNQSSFADDDIDDDTHTFQVIKVAVVLVTKITSSLKISVFTLTAWKIWEVLKRLSWEVLRELSWEILRELSLSEERSSTSESVESEKISVSEDSTIEFLDTRTILRVLEALNASRWSRVLKGALLRSIRLRGILII